jgi:hypothetical protein
MADSNGLKKTIQTPNGKGKVEKIYITELGHVMVKVKIRKNGIASYINYALGNLQKNIDTQDIFFL